MSHDHIMIICMCRYVATELATDIAVNVGDVKFYLHKVCRHLIPKVNSYKFIDSSINTM